MEVLRRLDISPEALARAGVRIYKVGLTLSDRADAACEAFARGPATRCWSIEEKGAGRRDAAARPCSTTRRRCAPAHRRQAATRDGRPLVSALGELRPSRLIEIVARLAGGPLPATSTGATCVRDFTPPELLSQRRRRASSACPTSAPAARTTPRPRCPKARTRRPASAATSWRAGWTATPTA